MTLDLLTGIRVVEFGQYIAAPAATQALADLGATVVKVESLQGDATRSIGPGGEAMFHAYNRAKQSLAVDLKDPDGLAAVRRVVDGADVLVHNMRPGAMDRLGLGATALTERNPRLIHASVTGFGPRATARAGLDIAAQAESGMMWINGEPGGEPLRVGFAVVDAAAAQNLAQAILAALYARERTGRGRIVEVSLLHTAVHLQAPLWTEWSRGGSEPIRCGNGQPTLAPAAELVGTKDGYVVLSAYTPGHWERLCHLIDRPDLLEDPRFADNDARLTHRAALREALTDAFSTRTSTEVVEWLSRAGLVSGHVRRYPEVVDSPDAIAGEIFAHLGDDSDPAGRYVTAPVRLDGRSAARDLGPPELGEHSATVLQEAGCSEADTARLIGAAVVGVPGP